MRAVLLAFLIGLAAGWGAYWYIDNHKYQAWRTKQKVMHQVEQVAHSFQEKFSVITAEAVREQLGKTGVYIVEKAKAAGAVVADAATDARITATIKTKLFSETQLSAMAINVDTTGGVVTLAGTVKSHDEVAKAAQIAVETEGVRKVISTLQVKPEQALVPSGSSAPPVR